MTEALKHRTEEFADTTECNGIAYNKSELAFMADNLANPYDSNTRSRARTSKAIEHIQDVIHPDSADALEHIVQYGCPDPNRVDEQLSALRRRCEHCLRSGQCNRI